MPRYDLAIRGGQVLTPAGTFERQDVAIAGDRVAAIEPELGADDAKQIIDASDRMVVPGLIDMHTHLGFELHTKVIAAEEVCPASGVTTAVDMGSTGAFTFPWYRSRVLDDCPIRLYEFLNIASIGTIAIHNPYYVEHYGDYIDVDDTVRTIQEHRNWIRGIKVFASSAMVGLHALDAVRAARRAAEATDLPVAVHISDAPPALEEILALLQSGDIITHSLTAHSQGILDDEGRVRPAVREARERGILFDVGHGAGSFNFRVARQALEQGFVPDTISTDVYYANVDLPVKDLLTTLSKFLELGLSLEDVLTRATTNAARALREEALGQLVVGGPADVAVLSLQEGAFTFVDSQGQTIPAQHLLACHATVCGGRVIYEEREEEAIRG